MQDEKSRIQNRAAALRVRSPASLVFAPRGKSKAKKELAGDVKASWGDQMRSYVLQPRWSRTCAPSTSQTAPVRLSMAIDGFMAPTSAGARTKQNAAQD